MKKIYVFMNGTGPLGIHGVAICEDGHCLAQHASSNEYWFRYDMGITSERKHNYYKKHCPEGYELIEVDVKDPRLDAAYKLNQELAKCAT